MELHNSTPIIILLQNLTRQCGYFRKFLWRHRRHRNRAERPHPGAPTTWPQWWRLAMDAHIPMTDEMVQACQDARVNNCTCTPQSTCNQLPIVKDLVKQPDEKRRQEGTRGNSGCLLVEEVGRRAPPKSLFTLTNGPVQPWPHTYSMAIGSWQQTAG